MAVDGECPANQYPHKAAITGSGDAYTYTMGSVTSSMGAILGASAIQIEVGPRSESEALAKRLRRTWQQGGEFFNHRVVPGPATSQFF